MPYVFNSYKRPAPYLLRPSSVPYPRTAGRLVRPAPGTRNYLLLVDQGLGAALPQGAQTIAGIAAAGATVTGLLIGVLAAIPVAGPIAAAIAAIGVGIANLFGGCGQTCVQATGIANKVGDYLKENLDTYLSAPVHYRSLQLAALNNFDTAWKALTAACSDPSLADAGVRCISDRAQASCVYHTSPGGWQGAQYTRPGANGSGQACWNYFVGFRDPIANDPTVVPDPQPAGTSSVLSAAGIDPAAFASLPGGADMWLLAGGLIAAGLLL